MAIEVKLFGENVTVGAENAREVVGKLWEEAVSLLDFDNENAVDEPCASIDLIKETFPESFPVGTAKLC